MYEVPSGYKVPGVYDARGVYVLAGNTLVHRREGRGTLEEMEMLVRRGARHAGSGGDTGAPRGAARWRRWRH